MPIDVDLLFGEPTVALRGPWGGRPGQDRPDREGSLRGPLRVPPRLPGQRARPRVRLPALGASGSFEGQTPTVYAHVATDPAHPGKLALQYWLFYVFNDWNNLHEGDWEMIQLVFDASTAARGAAAAAGGGRLQPARGRRTGGVGRRQARARRRHASGRAPGRRLARELLRRGALPRQLGRAGRRLRRHARADLRRPARRADDPERPGRRRGRSSRGSRSRAAGASSSRRSSTGRPGRT